MNARRRATLIAWLVGIGALVAAPLSTGSQIKSLEGDAVFSTLDAELVETFKTGSALAISLVPEVGQDAAATWGLQSTDLTVNWTREDATGFGSDPSSNATVYKRHRGFFSGEERFSESNVAFNRLDWTVNFLLNSSMAPSEVGARLGMSGTARPSVGEQWSGGVDGRRPTPNSGTIRLHGLQEIPAGLPILQFVQATEFQIRGNFSLYVWGSMVDVTEANGTVTSYRSGSWDSDEVGAQAYPRGVTREEHSQLVRLDVVDGILTLDGWKGLARVAASEFDLLSQGSVVFQHASAYLESTEFFYRTTDQSFELNGSIAMKVASARASPDQLSAHISAESIETTLPPAGRVPLPPSDAGVTGSKDAGKPNGGTRVNLNTPDSGGFGWLLWLLTVPGLLVAGWIVWRRRRAPAGPGPSVPDELILRAEEALARGEPDRARSFVQGVLRQDSLNVDAWFVHGASLVQQGAFRQAIEDLEPVVSKLKENRAGLAFLLCLSFLRMKKLGRARRWSRVAATDPDFRQVMEFDEGFRELQRGVVRGPAARVRNGLVTADVADVAYG